RDIRKLGGQFVLMPFTALLALFGTFSMAGAPLPFLNGFYSKELFLEASLNLPYATNSISTILITIIPYLAVIGSIFTFVDAVYLVFGTFSGANEVESLPDKPHEAPIRMLISPLILVMGVIFRGIFPNLANGSLLAHAASSVTVSTSN